MRKFSQFYRKFVAASVLMLALACSAFAGDMPLPNVTTPPPASGEIPFPGATSPSATTYGEVQYPGADESSLTQNVLDLLQGVLALF